MNPFTGGCHYSFGCDRFTQRCGACPQLGSIKERDLSAAVWRAKKIFFSSRAPEMTRIVATSKWSQGEARRSGLLSRFDIDLIPNCLDTSIFVPRARDVAREVFGLPKEQRVVLFVADHVFNHRKGFDLLLAALSDLEIGSPVTLACIGYLPGSENFASNVVSLGQFDNEHIMSFAYSAADVFVMPTRAEAFGQVVMEAMACATPVVSYAVGGIPDIVRPGRTGVLVPPENTRALRDAIQTVLVDTELRARLATESRRVAVAEYDFSVQAVRYIRLYESLIEASRRYQAGSALNALSHAC
jgi:glycosyltransferase involved in cell wall biosynthesis